MTRGIPSSPGRLGFSVALVLATVGLCACGGGGAKKTTSTVAHSTTAPATPSKPKPKPKLVLQGVRLSTAKGFASSVSARPGQSLVFHTTLGPSITSPVTVSLDFQVGPSRQLTVTATARHHVSKVTVTSATGKPLTLLHLHYPCTMPPQPSFCPAKGATSTAQRAHVSFTATHLTGPTLLAVVGPVSLPAIKTITPTTTVVPPYTVTQLLKLIPAQPTAASSAAAPTATLTVHPGDVFAMISRVTSRVHGATQPVTITIHQGPASSLQITSSVPGGQPSTATVKSATGAKIALVLPRFTCFLPPTPTFCPPASTSSKSHRYTLTFHAAPGTAPPVVLATVQAA